MSKLNQVFVGSQDGPCTPGTECLIPGAQGYCILQLSPCVALMVATLRYQGLMSLGIQAADQSLKASSILIFSLLFRHAADQQQKEQCSTNALNSSCQDHDKAVLRIRGGMKVGMNRLYEN